MDLTPEESSCLSQNPGSSLLKAERTKPNLSYFPSEVFISSSLQSFTGGPVGYTKVFQLNVHNLGGGIPRDGALCIL